MLHIKIQTFQILMNSEIKVKTKFRNLFQKFKSQIYNFSIYSILKMYAQTLQALSSKLQNSNKISLQQKRRQKQQAQLKLLSIQTFLNEKKRNQIQQLDSCKQSINSLTKLCDQTIKNFAIKSQKEQELVTVLREEVENEIQNQQKEHNQRVETILEESEQKIQHYIQQSQKKTKNQRDQGDSLLNQLSKRLFGLQKDFKQQSDTRKQNCIKITEQISEQIDRFRQQIDKEKEKRKGSQKKMNSMMFQIQTKIKQQLQNQSLKRKKNNEALLKLIQVACNKLQEAMDN